jgi:hypothetical protein
MRGGTTLYLSSLLIPLLQCWVLKHSCQPVEALMAIADSLNINRQHINFMVRPNSVPKRLVKSMRILMAPTHREGMLHGASRIDAGRL